MSKMHGRHCQPHKRGDAGVDCLQGNIFTLADSTRIDHILIDGGASQVQLIFSTITILLNNDHEQHRCLGLLLSEEPQADSRATINMKSQLKRRRGCSSRLLSFNSSSR